MRRRFALTVAATTSLVLLAFLVPMGFLVRDLAEARATRGAEQDARSLVQIVGSISDRAALAAAVQRLDAQNATDASVLLPDGTVLGAPVARNADVALAASGRAFTARTPQGRAVLVPVRLANGTAVVRVGVSTAQLQRGIRRSIITLVGLGLGLLVVAVLVADRLARGVVRPVEEQAAVAGELAAGRLAARVRPAGPPEVIAVGTALNRLAERIGELLASERESLADLSHRLRTPLTALRLDAEGLRDPGEALRMTGHLDAVERTVDDIIRTTRTAAADASGRSDAVTVVRERMAYWAPLAEDQGRATEVAVPDRPCSVQVARADLEAALDALIGNVFTHTPEGTAYRLAVELTGSVVRVSVADEGPGLEPDRALGRGQSGIGSTGLGLDIARRTAEAAGGELRVPPATSGTVVCLEMPIR